MATHSSTPSRRENTGKYWNFGAFSGLKGVQQFLLPQWVAPGFCALFVLAKAANMASRGAISRSPHASGRTRAQSCNVCNAGVSPAVSRASRPWESWARCPCHGRRGGGHSHLPLRALRALCGGSSPPRPCHGRPRRSPPRPPLRDSAPLRYTSLPFLSPRPWRGIRPRPRPYAPSCFSLGDLVIISQCVRHLPSVLRELCAFARGMGCGCSLAKAPRAQSGKGCNALPTSRECRGGAGDKPEVCSRKGGK